MNAGEQLLGWLYVGTPVAAASPAPRSGFDVRERAFVLSPDRTVTPLTQMITRNDGCRRSADRPARTTVSFGTKANAGADGGRQAV